MAEAAQIATAATTGWAVAAMDIDPDHLHHDEVTAGEVPIDMMADDAVVPEPRPDREDGIQAWIKDRHSTMTVLCPDADLSKYQTSKSSRSSHQKGMSNPALCLRLQRNADKLQIIHPIRRTRLRISRRQMRRPPALPPPP